MYMYFYHIKIIIYLFICLFIDPPFVTVQDDSVSVERGSTAVLRCNATSQLDVSLSWVFEGSPTLPMNSTVSDEGRTLIIGTRFLNHSGVYSCVATDGISTVTRDVRLNILCKHLNIFSILLFIYLLLNFESRIT